MRSLAKIAGHSLKAEQVDYKSIALLAAAHLSDDVNQGAVPAMLPFFANAPSWSWKSLPCGINSRCCAEPGADAPASVYSTACFGSSCRAAGRVGAAA
jgi:hypothetical protein